MHTFVAIYLLDLPLDLRQQIQRYTLANSEGWFPYTSGRSKRHECPLDLFFANRQLFYETIGASEMRLSSAPSSDRLVSNFLYLEFNPGVGVRGPYGNSNLVGEMSVSFAQARSPMATPLSSNPKGRAKAK